MRKQGNCIIMYMINSVNHNSISCMKTGMYIYMYMYVLKIH